MNAQDPCDPEDDNPPPEMPSERHHKGTPRCRADGSVRWVGGDPRLSHANESARMALWEYGTFITLREGSKDRIARDQDRARGRGYWRSYRIFGQKAIILDEKTMVFDLDREKDGRPIGLPIVEAVGA